MDPKEFYSYIKKNKVLNSTIGKLVHENVDSTIEEELISRVINTFFASISTTENLSEVPAAPAVHIGNKVTTSINVTESDIMTCNQKLKTISPRTLKKAKKMNWFKCYH